MTKIENSKKVKFSVGVLLLRNGVQWGSEIRLSENRKHSKTELFEERYSNGPVFKWSGRAITIASPDHSKTELVLAQSVSMYT